MFNNGFYGSANKDLPIGKVFSAIDVKKIDGYVYVRLSNNHWYPVKNLQCTTNTSTLSSVALHTHDALVAGNTSIIIACMNFSQLQGYIHELQVFFRSNSVPFEIKHANSLINVGYARIRLIIPEHAQKVLGLSCQCVVDPHRCLTGEQYAYLLRHQNK